MNKIVLFSLFVLLSATSLFAQNMTVKSLTLIEGDLRAQINPKVDINDQKCCAILISTPGMNNAQRRELEFQGDAKSEVVSVEFPTGEVEIYFSPHAKMLKIKHPDLPVLDYDIPIDLETLKTYRMVLNVEWQTNSYLFVNVEPNDALIFIDNKSIENKNGEAMKSFPISGKHTLRIEKTHYHTFDTIVDIVVNKCDTLTINKILRPAFGYIEVNSYPKNGATVIVNDVEVGTTPYRSAELESGEYKVRVIESEYKQSSQMVNVVDGGTTKVNFEMQPDFADITLITDSESTIYLDGEMVGKGKWIGKILSGSHQVEAKKENHRDAKQTITIEALKNDIIIIDNPTPIYGSLNVVTNPHDATIYIDNQEVIKDSPMLKQVMIGTHTVRVEKAGYDTFTKEIYVNEGDTIDVDAKLVAVVAAAIVPAKEKPADVDTINKGVKQKEEKNKTDKGFEKTNFLTLNFAYTTAPQTSFGLTFGHVKKFGWYLNAMTDFNFKALGAKLECDENGSIDGTIPYYSDETSKSRLAVTGGVLIGLTKNIYLKVGTGYGCRIYAQQVNDGTWVKNKAYSASGLELDGGLQFLFGIFNFSVEAATTNFKYAECKVGFGINFK